MTTRNVRKIGFAMNQISCDLQAFLPRFRKGAGPAIEYVFAFPFKKSPYWVVIKPSQSEWGILHTNDLLSDYLPSNSEARLLLTKVVDRDKDKMQAAALEAVSG